MNLIEISKKSINGADVNSVNARELWENLGIGKDFSNWVKTQIGSLGLVENIDYILFAQKGENPNQQNGRPKIEYIVTVDIAKHIALASRTPKGREIRNYFIEVEKQAIANKPKVPLTYKEALIDLLEKTEEIEELNAQIKADRPLVSFAKCVEASVDSVLIGNYAKMLSDTEGVVIGQNRLFIWLRENNYLITDGARHNVPYQKYIDNGYFEVSSQTFAGTTGTHQKFTTKITGKGQIALAQKIVSAFKGVV